MKVESWQRPIVPQIFYDRTAGGCRHWEAVGEMGLGPRYADDPVPPIDVVDPSLYDFGTSEPKIGNTPHHSVSASPAG
jgi:hypothetical protein